MQAYKYYKGNIIIIHFEFCYIFIKNLLITKIKKKMFGSPSIFLDVRNFGNYSTIFYMVRERFVAFDFTFVLIM